MFDLFAMLLSSVTSFLFPVFASYKALKTSDPAQLTPWLMYWVVFSICLLIESWFSFILFWIPFYGYARLLFFLYLILPQTQGARLLYEEKVHPFLQENENTIDEFIASAHNRLKTAGMAYFRQAIEYLKTNILNLSATEQRPAPARSASPSAASQGYTQSLLARFSVPSARWAGASNTGNEFYNLLANAVSAAAGGSSSARSASSSSTLIPPHLRDSAERMDFIAAQRERLNIVLGALDREAQHIQRQGNSGLAEEERPMQRSPSGLSKSRSETDFEKVEAESGAEDEPYPQHRRQVSPQAGGTGSWMPWGRNMGAAEGGGYRAGPKQD